MSRTKTLDVEGRGEQKDDFKVLSNHYQESTRFKLFFQQQ